VKKSSMPRTLLLMLGLSLVMPAFHFGKQWFRVMLPQGPATLGADLESVLGLPYPSFTGALFGELEEGGPAALAGLQPGDLVEYFDGEKVNGPCDLNRQLLDHEPGQEVLVFMNRGGGVSNHTMELADAQDLYEDGCDDGRAASCYQLGVLYDTGRGLPAADPARGRELFERACQGGSTKACSEISGKLLSGTGVAADVTRGRELAGKACEGGSAAGCAQLARAYAEGLGVPEDETRALGLYMDACDLGDAESCFNSSLRFERLRDVAPENGYRAFATVERACHLGDSRACTKTGTLYERGQDTYKDLEQARAVYRYACDGTDCHAGDPAGCFHLAVLLRDGSGGERDEAKAAELFRRSCNSGHDEACQGAAALHGFPSATAPGAQ
jgi:TPR repeat protein